jgi:hypothetical protein
MLVLLCLLPISRALGAERVVFTQGFDHSPDLAAYLGPQAHRFDLIGSSGGGEAAITYGALLLGKSDQAKASAYAARLTPLILEHPALRVSCTLTVSPDWSGSGSGALTFTFGQDFRRNGNTGINGRFAQLQIVLHASPVFQLFDPGTRTSSRRLDAAGKLHLGWFINGLSSPLPYTGPDSKTYTLEPRTMDAWHGPERLLNGIAVQGPENSPRQFALGIGGSTITHAGFLVDDLSVAELLPCSRSAPGAPSGAAPVSSPKSPQPH